MQTHKNILLQIITGQLSPGEECQLSGKINQLQIYLTLILKAQA